MNEEDIVYTFLVEYLSEIQVYALNVLINVNGYSIATMDDFIYAEFGMTFEQFLEER